jgi:hypothetical protein
MLWKKFFGRSMGHEHPELQSLQIREAIQMVAQQAEVSYRAEQTRQTALQSLPSSSFREISQTSTGESDDEDEAHECAICMGEFEPDDQVRMLPCEHYFHQQVWYGMVSQYGMVWHG